MKAHSSPFPEDAFSSSVDTTIAKPTEPEHEWEWKLSHHELSPVPLYHPMERTAVTISDIAVEDITRRISTFLKLNSITAQYEASRVSCMTDTLLKFVVHLWQSPEGVIIEVQRRQGCCIAMQAIRHHLIEAIQTGTDRTPPQVPSRSTCSVVQTLLDQMQCPPPPPQDLPCCSSALDLAKHLLQSDRFDAQRLGLESLCSLTNPTQVLLRDADHVSRTVLLEPEWQRLMSRYFESRRTEDDDIANALHFLALKTVTQAIEAATANGVKLSALSSTTPFWTLLVEDLFQNLIKASTCPLEASLSTRCFRYLQVLHPELLRAIYNNANLYDYLVQAHDFGKHHHRSLEMETEQWMGRLGFAY